MLLTLGMFCPSPVLFRTAVCGLPRSLSLIVRIPLRAPSAFGLKVTVMVQVPPLLGTDEQLSPTVAVIGGLPAN